MFEFASDLSSSKRRDPFVKFAIAESGWLSSWASAEAISPSAVRRHQLRLKLLKPGLGLLPLGKIADESGEEPGLARSHFADGKFHRERRAVLALAHHHAPDPDDAPLTCAQIACHIGVVIVAIGGGHQHLDVLADRLGTAVAKQPLRRGAEGLHHAVLIDDDHRLRHGVENRLQMRLAGSRVAPRTLQSFPEPCARQADRGESRGAPKLRSE